MFIVVKEQRYRVHIPAPYPFAISHGRIIGITPDAPAEMLDDFEAAWQKEYNKEVEDREWVVKGSKGREHQVLLIGDVFICDCWPYKRTGDCKHIESVKEECLC